MRRRNEVKTTVPGLMRDGDNPSVFRQTDVAALEEMRFKRRMELEMASLRSEVAELRAMVVALGART